MDKITAYDYPIKMIALDLDYTTLTGMSELSPHTEENLTRALAEGVHVVAATGRGFHTVPKSIMGLPGMRFCIASNGARIWDMQAGGFIYSKLISQESMEQILEFLEGKDYYFEIFVDGHGYCARSWYEPIVAGKIPWRPAEYIKKTRDVVEDLFAFTREHIAEVESVNIVYPDLETKLAKRAELDVLQGVEITTSFPRNWEIEAEGVGKGTALEWLADHVGVKLEEIMACGDSINDMELLTTAGLPVAVGNATDDIKEAAKYITDDYDKDGVANAMDRFVFGEK